MKVWDLLIIVGIVIGILGCHMPWGEIPTPSRAGSRIGTSLNSGFYTFLGLLAVAIFQLVFMIKRKVYMMLAVLTLGLVALVISVSWILNPVARVYGGYVLYPVLYGAYVTLLGALIVSTMAFLYIVATAKQQLSLNKSKEKL